MSASLSESLLEAPATALYAATLLLCITLATDAVSRAAVAPSLAVVRSIVLLPHQTHWHTFVDGVALSPVTLGVAFAVTQGSIFVLDCVLRAARVGPAHSPSLSGAAMGLYYCAAAAFYLGAEWFLPRRAQGAALLIYAGATGVWYVHGSAASGACGSTLDVLLGVVVTAPLYTLLLGAFAVGVPLAVSRVLMPPPPLSSPTTVEYSAHLSARLVRRFAAHVIIAATLLAADAGGRRLGPLVAAGALAAGLCGPGNLVLKACRILLHVGLLWGCLKVLHAYVAAVRMLRAKTRLLRVRNALSFSPDSDVWAQLRSRLAHPPQVAACSDAATKLARELDVLSLPWHLLHLLVSWGSPPSGASSGAETAGPPADGSSSSTSSGAAAAAAAQQQQRNVLLDSFLRVTQAALGALGAVNATSRLLSSRSLVWASSFDKEVEAGRGEASGSPGEASEQAGRRGPGFASSVAAIIDELLDDRGGPTAGSLDLNDVSIRVVSYQRRTLCGLCALPRWAWRRRPVACVTSSCEWAEPPPRRPIKQQQRRQHQRRRRLARGGGGAGVDEEDCSSGNDDGDDGDYGTESDGDVQFDANGQPLMRQMCFSVEGRVYTAALCRALRAAERAHQLHTHAPALSAATRWRSCLVDPPPPNAFVHPGLVEAATAATAFSGPTQRRATQWEGAGGEGGGLRRRRARRRGGTAGAGAYGGGDVYDDDADDSDDDDDDSVGGEDANRDPWDYDDVHDPLFSDSLAAANAATAAVAAHAAASAAAAALNRGVGRGRGGRGHTAAAAAAGGNVGPGGSAAAAWGPAAFLTSWTWLAPRLLSTLAAVAAPSPPPPLTHGNPTSSGAGSLPDADAAAAAAAAAAASVTGAGIGLDLDIDGEGGPSPTTIGGLLGVGRALMAAARDDAAAAVANLSAATALLVDGSLGRVVLAGGGENDSLNGSSAAVADDEEGGGWGFLPFFGLGVGTHISAMMGALRTPLVSSRRLLTGLLFGVRVAHSSAEGRRPHAHRHAPSSTPRRRRPHFELELVLRSRDNRNVALRVPLMTLIGGTWGGPLLKPALLHELGRAALAALEGRRQEWMHTAIDRVIEGRARAHQRQQQGHGQQPTGGGVGGAGGDGGESIDTAVALDVDSAAAAMLRARVCALWSALASVDGAASGRSDGRGGAAASSSSASAHPQHSSAWGSASESSVGMRVGSGGGVGAMALWIGRWRPVLQELTALWIAEVSLGAEAAHRQRQQQHHLLQLERAAQPPQLHTSAELVVGGGSGVSGGNSPQAADNVSGASGSDGGTSIGAQLRGLLVAYHTHAVWRVCVLELLQRQMLLLIRDAQFKSRRARSGATGRGDASSAAAAAAAAGAGSFHGGGGVRLATGSRLHVAVTTLMAPMATLLTTAVAGVYAAGGGGHSGERRVGEDSDGHAAVVLSGDHTHTYANGYADEDYTTAAAREREQCLDLRRRGAARSGGAGSSSGSGGSSVGGIPMGGGPLYPSSSSFLGPSERDGRRGGGARGVGGDSYQSHPTVTTAAEEVGTGEVLAMALCLGSSGVVLMLS